MSLGRKFLTLAAVVGVGVVGGGFASATSPSESATATVTFTVASVRDIQLSDIDIAFGTVPTDFGTASASEQDGGTATYYTNETGDQIAVKLNEATATGVALTVVADITTQGSADGTESSAVTLTASDQALITAIGPVESTSSAIANLDYTLKTTEATAVAEESYTVTYTVKSGA